jgi:hypothetical protein
LVEALYCSVIGPDIVSPEVKDDRDEAFTIAAACAWPGAVPAWAGALTAPIVAKTNGMVNTAATRIVKILLVCILHLRSYGVPISGPSHDRRSLTEVVDYCGDGDVDRVSYGLP